MTTTVDLSDPPRLHAWRKPLAAWAGPAVVYAAVLSAQIGLPFAWAIRQSAVYLFSLALLMIPVSRLSWRWMTRGAPTRWLIARHLAMGVVVVCLWRSATLLHDRLVVGP